MTALLTFACSTHKKAVENSQKIALLSDSLKSEGFNQQLNPPKDYSLWVKTEKAAQLGDYPTIHYVVTKDGEKQEIIREGVLNGGDIRWESDYAIVLEETLKVMPSPEDKAKNKQILHVKANRLSPYTSEEKKP